MMNIKTEACMDFDDNMAWGDDLDDGNEDEKDKTKKGVSESFQIFNKN